MPVQRSDLFDELIAEQDLTDDKAHSCSEFTEALDKLGFKPLAVFEETTFIGVSIVCLAACHLCSLSGHRPVYTQSKSAEDDFAAHLARHFDVAEDLRHHEEIKEIYGRRKETIERVFADAKEKHGI